MQISRRNMLKAITLASVGSTALLAQANQPKIITGIPEFDAELPNGLTNSGLCYVFGDAVSNYLIINQILQLNGSRNIEVVNIFSPFGKHQEESTKFYLQACKTSKVILCSHVLNNLYDDFLHRSFWYMLNSNTAISGSINKGQHKVCLVKNRYGKNNIDTKFNRVFERV